ncbi:MAG: MYXO-CTERM sorting domain-containing protein [bacterium]
MGDAGRTDAGAPIDASPTDGSRPDGARPDGGRPDARVADAGPTADAGAADADWPPFPRADAEDAPASGGGGGDDGCRAAPGTAPAGLPWLLVGVLALFPSRRRRRRGMLR